MADGVFGMDKDAANAADGVLDGLTRGVISFDPLSPLLLEVESGQFTAQVFKCFGVVRALLRFGQDSVSLGEQRRRIAVGSPLVNMDAPVVRPAARHQRAVVQLVLIDAAIIVSVWPASRRPALETAVRLRYAAPLAACGVLEFPRRI